MQKLFQYNNDAHVYIVIGPEKVLVAVTIPTRHSGLKAISPECDYNVRDKIYSSEP